MAVTKRQMQCYTLFEAQGYPPESAAAWVGNFVQESGTNLPSAFRSSDLDHGSEGLEQWRLDRLAKYEAFVKARHPEATEQELWAWDGNMALQVEYAAHECAHEYPLVEAQLRRGGDVGKLTEVICWHIERPSVRYANIAHRIAAAKAVFATAPHMGPASALTVANKTIATHSNNARGGAVVAIASSGGAMAIVANHVAWHMPEWGWLALGFASVVAVFGIVSLVSNAAKGAAVKSTLVAATPPMKVQLPATLSAIAVAPAPASMPASVPVPPSTPGQH